MSAVTYELFSSFINFGFSDLVLVFLIRCVLLFIVEPTFKDERFIGDCELISLKVSYTNLQVGMS